MNVFYASSDLFAEVCAVSMVSLLENNKSIEHIHFYIADDGISEQNKQNLTGIVQRYGHEIDFIPSPDPSEVFKFQLKDRYQLGHSYQRMIVGSLLPESVEKVLVLDSDTLVLADLKEFYEVLTADGDYILYGVPDVHDLKAYYKRLKIDPKNFSCNAGVFVVNLKKYREDKIELKIRENIIEANGNIFWSEQTLMNRTCQGKIKALPLKYNAYSVIFAFDYDDLITFRRPTSFYSKSEVEDAKKNPAIIHFTRNFYMQSRPWIEGCQHPFYDQWLKYHAMTPWKNSQPQKMTAKQKLKRKILHALPVKLWIGLMGSIYNDIRPRIWWLNE